MIFKRITDSSTIDFKETYDIYKTSFPIFEQRTLQDQLEALSDQEYFCHAIQDEQNKNIGLLFTWRTDSFIYIEHLAILESERGKNIGTNTLKMLKESTSLPIILEIDPPVDAISIRRKGFYESLGFVMSDFKHIHPAFTKESGAYDLKIMSIPAVDIQLYNDYFNYLENKIMYYSYSRKG